MTNMANLQRVCSDSRLKNRIHSPFRIQIRNVGTMSPNTVEKIHTVFTLAAFSVGVSGIILQLRLCIQPHRWYEGALTSHEGLGLLNKMKIMSFTPQALKSACSSDMD